MKKAPLGKAGRDLAESLLQEHCIVAPSECSTARKYRERRGARSTSFGTINHPFPSRGVYGSNSGIIVPSASELWSLLHLDRAKAVAQSGERYRNPRVKVTHDDVEKHLAGKITLAFTVLCCRHALFAGLDVDVFFPNLLPVVRAAVLAIGGVELAAAVFCTNGSDDGRGKIIVTFSEPVPARHARKLIQRLRSLICAKWSGEPLQPGDLGAYPQEESGGLVRILGRNPARGGLVEGAFSLDAEPGLGHVRPLTPGRLTKIADPQGDTIAPWAVRLIETPWLRSEPGGNRTHFGHMVALAREAIRIYRRGLSQSRYDDWLNDIKRISPELSAPSNQTNDRRNVIDHARLRAWKFACEKPNSWEPLDLQIRKDVPRGVVRAYNTLASYAREKGLRPECFGMDYERLAEKMESSKSTAYRSLQRAAEIGSVVIHDRGFTHTKGGRGQCVLVGIVGRGESTEGVRAAGLANERVRQRQLDRERYDAKP